MWVCMCGLSGNHHFVTNHIRKQQMKKITKSMYMKMKATRLKLRIGKNVTTTLDNISNRYSQGKINVNITEFLLR